MAYVHCLGRLEIFMGISFTLKPGEKVLQQQQEIISVWARLSMAQLDSSVVELLDEIICARVDKGTCSRLLTALVWAFPQVS